MRLNTLRPAEGSKKALKRVGRGIGSGLGKTCGRGHKGQKARKSGNPAVGFEGGQMPLYRRLPKYGFSSHIARETAEIRLSDLQKIDADVITFNVLKEQGVVDHQIKYAKVILSGTIQKPVHLKGIRATKGARAAIEASGGKVEV